MLTKTIDEENLLKYALAEGIISLDDVMQEMREKEKQRILQKHKNPIFQDKDGRWKTTLPDEEKGRKLLAKKYLPDLEKVIIEYYSRKEDDEYNKTHLITLRTIFPEWLNYKFLHTNASSYIRRIKNDWNKYYESNYIVDIPLSDLTFLELDIWSHGVIKKENLTKKQYYNMTLIIRQCLKYAKDKEIIDENVFCKVHVDGKMFKRVAKPKSETQVFSTSIEDEIIQAAMTRYYKSPRSISPLAIVFNFNLGLRVGELVSIKWSDISGNYIHIQRMEVADYILTDNATVISNSKKVTDHTKSYAGDRELYLNEEARNILNIVKKRNMTYGYYDNNYIFVTDTKTRLAANSINQCLYKLCNDINTSKKSSHKIRKTYISSLFDGNVNINKIREIAGHEDEKTSLNNYCFDRNVDVETEKLLENIAKKRA